MRAHWRAGRRRGLATLAALSLVLVTAQGSIGAEEEEGTKNLSTPVIMADEDVSDMFNPVTVPDEPEGNADYTKGELDYFTSLSSETYASTIDEDFDADTWGADRVFEDTDDVGALAKWGDNLVSHQFPGNGTQPIRVEMNLFADEDTAAAYGELEGYEMVSLEGSRRNELFGTLGVATPIAPMVFTPDHKLTILKYSSTTKRYTIPVYDGPMSVEVNGSGKLIYGFVWGAASGLPNPTQGNYRLAFRIGSDSLVNLTGIMESEDEEGEEGPLHTPMIYGDKISYLDISLGTPLVSPPVRFGAKNDFNLDGYPDMYGRTVYNGDLWFEPGNGAGGFDPSYRVGRGWGQFTAIVAPGDFDGDGIPDLLARKSTGELLLYPGTGTGSFSSPVRVAASGWNVFNRIVGVGDFNGDGNNDVMGRTASGALWIDPGDGDGGFLTPRQVATGWNVFTIFTAVNDFNGDGRADLAGRTASGYLWLDPGNGTGGFLKPYPIASGWNVFNTFIGVDDFNSDLKADIIGRAKSNGDLWLDPGNGTGGFLTPYRIARGWSVFNLLIA